MRSRAASIGKLFSSPARLFVLLLFPVIVLSANAALMITEFAANNDGMLKDEDFQSPDWIEIYNSGPGAVDLVGWHLTDDVGNLAKWTFPSTNLSEGDFLVVFASGKDRASAGSPLHTNFQLDNDQGYLALVHPGGTVAHAYAPTYPNQRANVSYGLAIQTSTASLISSGTTARVLVPANGTLGTTWTATGFNDSSWTAVNTPVGYSVGTTLTPVLLLDVNERITNVATMTPAGFSSFVITSNVSATAIQTQATVRVFGALTVTVSNTSPYGYDDRLRTTPANSGAFTDSLLLRDFLFSQDLVGNGGLDVGVTGLAANQGYRFTVWSFDSQSTGNRVSDWYANGSLVKSDYVFNGATAPTSNDQYRFTFDASATGSGGMLISGRRDSTSTSFGVFLNALQIEALATQAPTNALGALMLSNNATAYLRVPFNVANPAAFQNLKLRMKYDDGFVAYINGQVVASRNAPGSPLWDSTATAAGADSQSLVYEDIIFTNAPGLLSAGANVLAIHGLNVGATDADFLILPELEGLATGVAVERYFTPPTPGTDNGAGYLGLVADTKFSVDRGFYDTPFTVAITSATATASIYFTTNGSIPSPTTGTLYTSPIPISGTRFLRAAAFLTNYVPSVPDTHTYVFLNQVLRQSATQPGYPTLWQASYPADYGMDSNIVGHPVYGLTISNDLRSIPTLSIVSDQDGLWNSSTGIYPNPTSVGPAWERAASIELIRGDGHTEFQENCGIEIHGNASRDNVRTPKHSIGLTFSSDYGASKLRYDWFGGGVDVADKIVLRSCGFVDGWAGRYADNGTYVSTETGETFRGLRYRPENTCYLRDAWVKDSFRDMGWSASRSQFVHLYINGLYWGLYEPSEHLDASYFSLLLGGLDHTWDVLVGDWGLYEPSEHLDASYFSLLLGGLDHTWDVLVGEDNNGPPVLVDGSLDDWQNVLNLVNAGVASETDYAAITNLMDIDNLIDYMALHIFAESEDWPRHNWFVAHRRATNGVPATRFICTPWDQELTLDRLVRRDRTDVGNSGGEVYGPARVYAQLRAWPEFLVRFGDRIQKHLFNGGALTPSNNVSRLLAPAAMIHDALVGESARWGDARKTGVPAGQIGTGVTFTRDEWWQPEIDKTVTNFFQHLTADNLARFRAANLYPSLGAPEFSQFGGAVPNGFALVITHTNVAGAIYFTLDGSDPREYGTGTVSANAQSYSVPILIQRPTVVRSRVLSAGDWSALVEATFYPPQDLSKLALTEIMYHPPDLGLTPGNDLEFLELKNTGTTNLDLSGLTFTSGITFTFTNGTILGPGQFFVLARNAAAFALKYPGVTVGGTYTGQIDNAGEQLTLAEALGSPVFSVTYDDLPPWPVTPDVADFSLVPRNPGTSQAPDKGNHWRASTNPGGSPGADDPAPNLPPIVIDEILTHTDLPQKDSIELFNPTATNVNIGGWFLTDEASVPNKYRIPNNTIIAASGRVVFNEDNFNPTPGVGNSFAISSTGDDVYLFSATTNGTLTGYNHSAVFGASFNGISFGRYVNSAGEEFYPSQLTLTLSNVNSGPRIGPVVISEIHYHPATNGDEFVELFNLTGNPVPLYHTTYPTNAWKLGGIGYDFPTNVTLASNATLLVVATNPASFRAKYNLPTNVLIFGPYTGTLQDNGENLELLASDNPNSNAVPFVVIDAVRYNDKAPWPPGADGSGLSLQRSPASGFGNEPTNWIAAAPTPGQAIGASDSDGDGLPDWWEQQFGTFVFIPDANADPDGDGMTNLQEYLAGTHPHDATSVLKFLQTTANAGVVTLQFLAVSNHTYTVLHRPLLETGSWLKLADVMAQPTNRLVSVTNATSGSATRFYRLVTPAQP
jgi:hypothetical protein